MNDAVFVFDNVMSRAISCLTSYEYGRGNKRLNKQGTKEMHSNKFYLNLWFEIMKKIRTLPGTVYESRVEKYIKGKLSSKNDDVNVDTGVNEHIDLKKYFECFGNTRNTSVDKIESVVKALNEAGYKIQKEYKSTLGDGELSDEDRKSDIPFLKMDAITKGIYTIPRKRKVLDYLLNSYWGDETLSAEDTNEENKGYSYNKFLYRDEYAEKSEKETDPSEHVKFENGTLNIFFEAGSVIRDFSLDKLLDGLEGREDVKRIGSIFAENVIFTGDTFLGFEKEEYNSITVNGGLFFDKATFTGVVEMNSLVFCFEKDEELFCNAGGKRADRQNNAVDFRNARFFKSLAIKDVSFGGDTSDVKISFEDARVTENVEFINVDFGSTELECFQMVFGNFIDYLSAREYERLKNDNPSVKGKTSSGAGSRKAAKGLSIINCEFDSDCMINLKDAEISNGCISFHNIAPLPKVNVELSPIMIFEDAAGDSALQRMCPSNTLIFDNCEISNTLMISNVDMLSFRNSRNYGKIIASEEWGTFDKRIITKSRGLMKTRLGGTRISNDILIAVYNYDGRDAFGGIRSVDTERFRAADFIMLKENFAADGKYDDEDDAFILFMECRPYQIYYEKAKRKAQKKGYTSSVKQNKKEKKSRSYDLLYKCLYHTGKYGISPVRVTFSLLFTVLLFTGIYLIFAIMLGNDAFSLANTGNNMFDYSSVMDSGIKTGFSFMKLLASFLYSLESIIPFVSAFEPISVGVCIATAIENAIGSFLIGYFSVAVVRKTLR